MRHSDFIKPLYPCNAIYPCMCRSIPCHAPSPTAETSKDLWYWDFTPLCNPDHWSTKEKNPALNDTIHFNFCGYADTLCSPTWDPDFKAGAAIQIWGKSPDNPGTANCKDLNGQPIQCTADCQVLGRGLPNYFVVDPNNPQYGGINITHDPVPSGDEIGHGECPPDYERGGAPGDRTVTYNIQCDKKGKKGSRENILRLSLAAAVRLPRIRRIAFALTPRAPPIPLVTHKHSSHARSPGAQVRGGPCVPLHALPQVLPRVRRQVQRARLVQVGGRRNRGGILRGHVPGSAHLRRAVLLLRRHGRVCGRIHALRQQWRRRRFQQLC